MWKITKKATKYYCILGENRVIPENICIQCGQVRQRKDSDGLCYLCFNVKQSINTKLPFKDRINNAIFLLTIDDKVSYRVFKSILRTMRKSKILRKVIQ